MTYKEKNIITSLFTSLVVGILYFGKMYLMYQEGRFEGEGAAVLLGKSVFVLIGVSIVTTIIVTILFSIIHAIITNNPKPSFVVDERDQMIEIRGNQIMLFVFSAGFIAAFGALALGQPPLAVLFAMLAVMFVASITDDLVKLALYRTGL